MGITRSLEAPSGGGKVVMRALRDLHFPNVSAWKEALGGTGAAELSQPLPIFYVGLDDLEQETPPDDAPPMGWRYLIEADGQSAFADVRQDADGGRVRFVSLSRNSVAASLHRAAHLAEAAVGGMNASVDVSLVDAPAVKVSALQLDDGRRTYIAYVDGSHLFGAHLRIIPEHEFFPTLRREAAHLKGLIGTPGHVLSTKAGG